MQASDLGTDRFLPLDSGRQVASRSKEPSKQHGPWRCGNCPREFAQKEYRYKHQQRCIQASNRPKHSKQKSCVACAGSKIRCDQRTPSCSRCLSRRKSCQYLSTTAPSQESGPDVPENQPMGIDDLYLPGITDDFVQVPSEAPSFIGNDNAAALDGESGFVAGLDLDFDMRAQASTGNARQGTSPGSANNANPQARQQLQRRASTLRDAAGSNTDWPMGVNINGVPNPSDTARQGSLPSLTSPGWSRLQTFGMGVAASDSDNSSGRWHRDNEPWASRSPLLTPEARLGADIDDDFFRQTTARSMNNDMNFDLLGSLGILKRHRIDPTQLFQSPQGSARSGIVSNPSTNFFQQGGGMAPATVSPSTGQNEQNVEEKTLHDAVKTTYGDAPRPSGPPSTSSGGSSWPTSCPFHKLNSDDALVKIIRNYPRIMVRPGQYPPFVHHKLYRCGAGDIAEPLARAFCCVGAFYASVPTSEGFVYSMISEESRRLVQGFHRSPNSDSDMLAVVHAMCIYQIIGFFSSSNTEHARATELQHSFFLKMTRLLIRQYLQELPPSEVTREMAWRKWIVNETIRRTVFLVNAINTLSCRVQKQDANFYEALDDNLVRNMALPASDWLWKASSAEEWLAAREQLGPEETASGRITVQQVIDQFVGSTQGGSSNRSRGSYANGQDMSALKFAQLDDFTQLVVATAGNTDYHP